MLRLAPGSRNPQLLELLSRHATDTLPAKPLATPGSGGDGHCLWVLQAVTSEMKKERH